VLTGSCPRSIWILRCSHFEGPKPARISDIAERRSCAIHTFRRRCALPPNLTDTRYRASGNGREHPDLTSKMCNGRLVWDARGRVDHRASGTSTGRPPAVAARGVGGSSTNPLLDDHFRNSLQTVPMWAAHREDSGNPPGQLQMGVNWSAGFRTEFRTGGYDPLPWLPAHYREHEYRALRTFATVPK
jgi:hypothetical protein